MSEIDNQEPMQTEENGCAGASGSLQIADDVIAVIASMAVADIKGITSAGGGIAELWNKKGPGRGVKVSLNENRVVIDMFIVVEYGVHIPEVARSIQDKIKLQVETMTGVAVDGVNIHVQGVNMAAAEQTQEN